jgi:two-component system, NtrC family, sensor histidine kinase HydH
MVLLVVVLVGCTTVAMGTLAYRRARRALEAAANARLEVLARDIARDLHRELADRVADITTWARLESMVALTFGDVDKQLAEFLRQTREGRDVYLAIVALDREGRPVAGVLDADDAALVGGASSSPELRVVPRPGDASAALALATPVFNPRRPGERIGALVALLDPERLLQAVTAGGGAQDDSVTITLRDAGQVLGTVHPASDRPSKTRSDAAPDTLEMTAPVVRLAGVRGPALSILVREPAHIALASILSLRDTLMQVAVAVLLLSALAGGFVAWRVSVPIRRLTASVESITSRGRPEPVLGLPTGAGEVGVLGAAFEAMLERLAAAQDEAVSQSRLALLGEVAASIAHDVRTPLSVLKTSAQLLASGDLPVTEQRSLGRMVAAEVDRLNRVVTDLVDLARPRVAQRMSQPVDQLVQRAAAVLRPWAQGRGVALEVVRDGPELHVIVDGDQMQQALLNLMHNAVQAAPNPGSVVVRSSAQGRWAVIEVSDSGPGFSEDALARAFSPFFTTRPDGTGLGLTIVKRIIEEHGGDVGARNPPGGGACVWCRLPQAAVA